MEAVRLADSVVYGLSDKLKQLRKKQKLTQQMLADRLNVDKNTISRYETDRVTPPIENLIQLAIIYNTSVDYLLGVGKESFLYLHEFTDEQKAYILKMIDGLKENFDYGDKKTGK